MNNKYISLLEQYKNNREIQNEFTPDVQQEIKQWYCNNIGSFEGMSKALELMYYFYIHENFDFYEIQKYQDECTFLRENYLLTPEKALLAFDGFRHLIYKG